MARFFLSLARALRIAWPVHLFLWAEDAADALEAELAQAFPTAVRRRESWLEADFDLAGQALPTLAFARQWLPNAQRLQMDSIRGWAGAVAAAVAGVLPDDQPWSLHVVPHYGLSAARRIGARAWHSRRLEARAHRRTEPVSDGPAAAGAAAGRHRCRLIGDALVELLGQKRRHLLRRLRREPAAFTAQDSLAQLLLTEPETGFLSVVAAPLPFEQRQSLSPFPKGVVQPAADPKAPSRAFAKLVEAEQRLGCAIRAGDLCVDLGAAPGSWTYAAANRGARVTAVDRSPLREDLMRHALVEFRPGDAFRFQPARPADWLLCDVIAPPERTAALLLHWLQQGWCRQFVVTLKLQEESGWEAISSLKRELPQMAREWFLLRLCANKKELCAFGSVAQRSKLG